MQSPHARLINKAALTSALLTLTGLTLLPSAQAQKLTLGQYGSTTASGTATLTGTGTTASGTYTYINAAGNPAPLNPIRNTYSYWDAYGSSTANVSSGSITTDLATFDTSTANVSGGFIFDLVPQDTSTANVSGGNLDYLDSYNASTAYVSGGSISTLQAFGTSTANISGGSITYLYALENSTANIIGGSVYELEVAYTNTVNVSGGSVNYLATNGTSTANISGGSFVNLFAFDASTIDFFGTDLTETLASTPQNVIAPHSSSTEYMLTGTLADGDPLNAIYYDNGGTLEFNGAPAAVPEASSVVSLGVLLALGLGGLVVSVRRRKAMSAG